MSASPLSAVDLDRREPVPSKKVPWAWEIVRSKSPLGLNRARLSRRAPFDERSLGFRIRTFSIFNFQAPHIAPAPPGRVDDEALGVAYAPRRVCFSGAKHRRRLRSRTNRAWFEKHPRDDQRTRSSARWGASSVDVDRVQRNFQRSSFDGRGASAEVVPRRRDDRQIRAFR